MSRDFISSPARDFLRSPNRDRVTRGGGIDTGRFWVGLNGGQNLSIYAGNEKLISAAFDPPYYQRTGFPSSNSFTGGGINIYDEDFNPIVPALDGVIPSGQKIRFEFEVAGFSMLYNPNREWKLGAVDDDPIIGGERYEVTNPDGVTSATHDVSYVRRGSVATMSVRNFIFPPTADAWDAYKSSIPTDGPNQQNAEIERSLIGGTVDKWTSGSRLILNQNPTIGRLAAFWRKRIVTVGTATANTIFNQSRGLEFQMVALDQSRAKLVTQQGYYAISGYAHAANPAGLDYVNPIGGGSLFAVPQNVPGFTEIVWGKLTGATRVAASTPSVTTYETIPV